MKFRALGSDFYTFFSFLFNETETDAISHRLQPVSTRLLESI